MLINFIYKDELNTITLPSKIEGQYWINYNNKKIISIDGNDNAWNLVSNRKAKVLDENDNIQKKTALTKNCLRKIKIGEDIATIFTEPLTENRQKYIRKNISKDIEISIGRENNNVIVFKNDFVSSNHAILTYRNNYWSIKDNNSINGVYVNGKKIKEKNLDFGDVIYIMGLKIVVFYNFIMFNNPDNSLALVNGVFEEPIAENLDMSYIDFDEDDEDFEEELKKAYFYPSPRLKKDIEQRKIKVDNPPEKQDGEKLPFALTVGPSITMGLASFTTAVYSVNNAIAKGDIKSQMPSIVMSVSMLMGTLLWPICTKMYDKRNKKKKEKERQEKYSKYLEEIDKQVNDEKEKQEKILKENFVTIDECEDRILKVKRNLWERGISQSDFLDIRLGVGNLPLNLDLSYTEKRFSLKEDNLLDKMYELCEKPKQLENVPVTISFYDKYISGVIGDKKQVYELAKGIIFELAALYSYDEVKMIFLYNSNDSKEFEFVKWLPHTFSDDKKFRFVATNLDEVKEISYYLDDEIINRGEMNENKKDDMTPYYIVFSLDKDLSLKSEFINKIYNQKKNINFSVINFFESLQDLPKECMTIIETNKDSSKIYDKNDITGNSILFKPDIYLTASPTKLSIKLANILLNSLESGYQLPSVVNFLQMFEVGKVEHLNVLSRWQDNDPTKSLATPIGIDTYGELFKLDLHEKFHGPHGLVAGMTGSGKSEFIITYILSLAINYHPNEVSFILIDYKGGGMAKSFEHLPHVAGIITNLDGSSINRAIISINSELKRRQAIFDMTSKKVGVSNIDIYKYQKLFREGKVSEPLPHLFIISDEFAELKSQQPEFMAELISAARIGRSLGVHLILATQKPNGVVDDQIWSNTKFRVCLKVGDKADSMDMLKRPDAAMLKDTGRFYLQVGYNELFELGQSAWAGAPYYPSDRYIEEKDNSIVIIDKNARVVRETKIDKNRILYGNAPKQLDAITKYLSETAKAESIHARPIWLDPLKESILLDDIEKKYGILYNKFDLCPVIGEYDDPVNQKQSYLRIPISESGNLLLYGSQGSGKAMFITTLIYSIIEHYSPEEVNIYALDFESETLKSFEKAPHIGDVILSFESEKITNLMKTLYKEMENRKKKFAEYGGTFKSYINESGKTVPNILVALNNYAAFLELYPDKEDAIALLTREGARYGIYFVFTANATNEVKFKIAQNFSQIITLQFNDESNYQMILGKTGGIVPSHFEGRGLTKIEKHVYEFQTARITSDNNPYKYIKEECSKLTKKYQSKASKIAVLPNKITDEILIPHINNTLNIPIGMEKNSLDISYFKLDKHYINMVLSEDNSYLSFLTNFSNFINRNYKQVDLTVIDEANDVKNLDGDIKHIVGSNNAESIIDELYELVLMRNNKYKEALETGEEIEAFNPKIFIINSIRTLFDNKDNIRIEKLELALSKGSKKYNINFVIFDELKKLNLFTSKEWYKTHVKSVDGIWLGNGLANQYLLKVNNSMDIKKELTDKDFAYVIDESNAKLVKIISAKENMNE